MDDSTFGYIGMIVAVIGFGSNFVPLKNIKIGDGVFFQFCMCNAVFATSIPLLFIQHVPPIHGLAILGGMLWCSGNILCPLVIKFIGMGLGLIIWGCAALICGWASGTFGLFGLTRQEVSNPVMNFIGVGLCIVGLIVYLQVQTNDTNFRSEGGARYAPVGSENSSCGESDSNHSCGYLSKNSSINDMAALNDTAARITNPLLEREQHSCSRNSVMVTIDALSNHQGEQSQCYPSDNDTIVSPDQLPQFDPPTQPLHQERAVSNASSDVVRTVQLSGERSDLTAQSLYSAQHNSTTSGSRRSSRRRKAHSQASKSIGDDWSAEQKRVAGILCALLAGCCIGLSFDPAQYVIDNKYGGNDDSLNYVFSQYLGILLASWGYTIVYCIYHRWCKLKPFVTHEIIVPATFSGLIWGVSMIGWFLANGRLGFPITFPIVSAGPGFVGALWGVFVFKEITGKKNLGMLVLAIGITVPALILVALSH